MEKPFRSTASSAPRAESWASSSMAPIIMGLVNRILEEHLFSPNQPLNASPKISLIALATPLSALLKVTFQPLCFSS